MTQPVPQPYLVVGLEGTGTQPRLEINDLQSNSIQFSLFIRALNNIFDMKSEDVNAPDYVQKPNSWWQLAGIHGRPYVPWSGDPNGPQKPVDGSTWGGKHCYCYHAAALFPTWHRVVVLLAEQAVVREAINIASNLPDDLSAKSAWVQAAQTLRFPYWDWTSEQTREEGIPEIFQLDTIDIANPSGAEDDEVRNPLSYYQFPDNHKAGPGDSDIGAWSRTYRWVDFTPYPPTEDYEGAKNAFQKGGGPYGTKNESVSTLRRKVAGLFNYPLSIEDGYGPNLWGHFSNTNSSGIYVPEKRYESLPSLEDPHNHVHLDIGGIGTMSHTDYAGFDPIFYMHHCNIDRIYAFWEWVYPDYWIGNQGWKNANGDSVAFRTTLNFSQALGSEIMADSPLLPFRSLNFSYWTSEEVRGLLSAGEVQKYYTYPGITDTTTNIAAEPHLDNSAHTPEDREKFRQALYNQWGTDLATEVRNIREIFAARRWDAQIRNLLLEEPEGTEYSYLRNFVIVGDVPEFAFPGSYRLELYLPASGNSPAYVIDDVSVFARFDPAECAACKERRAAGSKVRGHMHLDPLLIIRLIDWYQPRGGRFPGGLSPLDWLVGQIKERLRLRLVKSGGTKLADTETTENDGRDALEADKIPRVTLHWHRIWFYRNELSPQRVARRGYIPLGLHEAEEYGELELGGAWKKA